jgi:hypothetical protein
VDRDHRIKLSGSKFFRRASYRIKVFPEGQFKELKYTQKQIANHFKLKGKILLEIHAS